MTVNQKNHGHDSISVMGVVIPFWVSSLKGLQVVRSPIDDARLLKTSALSASAREVSVVDPVLTRLTQVLIKRLIRK